jgi:hypothetical protein
MRKTNQYILGICLSALAFTSCKDFLDRSPISTPTTGSFLNTEGEMNGALTGLYQSAYWNSGSVPYQVTFDHWTDFGVERAPGMAAGIYDTYDGNVLNIWSFCYTMIQRANTLLDGMVVGKDKVAADTYNRIQAEARTLRVFAYFHLVNMYGDVPLITKVLKPSEYNPTRTPKAEVVKFMLDELDECAKVLKYTSADRGRLTKGVVLGLKARIALYDGQFDVAAKAAKLVIDEGGYGLNPKFQDLFTRSGQNMNANKEIMFELMFADAAANSLNYLALGQGSRNLGAQSGKFPTQRLVDLFEDKNGKRIDESTIYDPAHPSKNRDSRLRWTVMMTGDTITLYGSGNAPRRCVFDVYNAKTDFYNFTTNTWAAGDNQDLTNAYGPAKSGVGYLWAKYTFTDEDITKARVSWVFMRYAEILLTYAEAKIELGQLDGTVTDAINKVRLRSNMPVVDAGIVGNQDKMRQLVRRERGAELALEGFRWFDIRRWKIAELVMPGKVYGAAKTLADAPAVPNFKKSAITDVNNIPDYSATASKLMSRDERVFLPRHYLFPIPQNERNLNKNLSTNLGWE